MATVPVDGRPQFSLVDVAINVGLGRRAFAGFEQIGPDRYVLAGSFPAPKASDYGATPISPREGWASSPAPDAAPRSAGAALWPNLK